MKCKPTNVPPADEVNISEVWEKYRIERDRRIRKDGQHQYVASDEDFTHTYEGDPYTPFQEREPISRDIDVVVLGGGWSGLLTSVELTKAGITDFCNIDHAGDFGGVWYWNRYPGIQCDNDAYCYLPLLEEMGFMPSKKYSDGWEICDYMQSIAKRFDLHNKALFHTMINSMKWDDNAHRWIIDTDRGDHIRARFVIMANGLLNIPKLPAVPGISKFKGKLFHTARWDYEYTGGDWRNPVLDKLSDKRVCILGTGATALQAIPYLSRHAKELYVIQRTPATVEERYNAPTDPEWVKTLKPGWQKERIVNFHRGAMEQFQPGDPDLVCDFWTEINRNMAAELEAEGWPELTLEEYMQRREIMDYRVMERMRRRVEASVTDPETAEKLKPWYRFLCKRPLSNDEYYDAFNRPNVKLLDVSDTQGLQAMTENGFIVDGTEYPIDCMIFASGFEVTSDMDRRWGIETIEGRNGQSIYKNWEHGYKTLHGMMTHGFPNQFYIGFYQGGLNSTTTEVFRSQGEHISAIIKQTLDRGASSVEPSQEAQDAWIRHIRETAIDISAFQDQCTPSYFNNEGEKEVGDDGKEHFRWYLGESYGPGWDAFQTLMQEWRDSGELEGLVVQKNGQ